MRVISQMFVENDPSLEITAKMLAAVVFETPETPVVEETATLAEQMLYLQKYIGSIPIDDRRDIGRVLVLNNRTSDIVSCSEGVVINMDKLPDQIINQMYTMLKVKIEKLSK